MPGAVPPTESLQQIRQSRLLEKVESRRGRSCCFLDGNRAWKSHAMFLGLKSREVSHQNREFTKDLRDTVPGLSATGGTQKLDRCKRSLREFIPRSSPLKAPSSKNVDSHTQPKVKWLLYQWVWRQHETQGDDPHSFLQKLAALF